MQITKVIPRRGPRGFQRITWAADKAVPGDLFRQDSATISEYRSWISYQSFSALLFDGSIVQISYDFDYQTLVGHRLVYFPSPFDFDRELLEAFGLFEAIEEYQGSRVDLVRLRSPIRFDYDSTANPATHPASHMTFEWSHCRIPVVSPLSPGHFIRFLFKNFYPSLWNDHEFIQEWPRHNVEPTISPEDLLELHINSFTVN